MSVQPSYTACLNNTCPITHKTFGEIETPVVFRWNPTQPYECAALAQWLRVSSRDPMTNLRIDRDCLMDDIAPLCGYSTVETVHTILGDLIGKKQCSKKWAGNVLTLHSLLYIAGRSFDIVGVAVLSVNGIIAPRPALQNILGDNWPTPPLKIDHVSYVYVSGDEQVQKI